MRLLMQTLLLVTMRPSCLTITHLHVLVSFPLFFFLFFSIFVLAAAALGFEILATSIGVFIFLFSAASSLFGASHFFIFSASFGLFGCKFGFKTLLKLDFLGTIVGAIVFNYVNFWLLRWEFGRR